MKFFHFLLLLVGLYPEQLCFAQSAKGDNPVVKQKTIRMPKFATGDFPKKSLPVSNIRIIQFVKDSTNLGYVLKGADNQVAVLKTSNPLTEMLQSDIEKMYSDDYKKEGQEMLWVLKDLRIAEKSAFMEYSYLRFNADAYFFSQADHKYHLVSNIDTVFFSESSGDVTNFHGSEIENAFKLLLKQSLQKAPDSLAKNMGLTREQIVQRSERKNAPAAIITTGSYKEGGYVTFQEFLDNKPMAQNFETVVVEKNKIKFIKTGTADTLNLWGICRNGEIYKYNNDALIPIERAATGFIISDYLEKVNRRNSNVFGAAMFGGVAGALIAGSSKRDRAVLVSPISSVPKTKKLPEASLIDMETGELSF